MKILHTADWHAGRVLHGQPRTGEIREVLREIAELAHSEAVDLVLVAGDLYDTRNPGAEAEAAGRHHAHTTTRTGTIDTIIATGAAEVAGHQVSDDELAESPVFSSLVEEKDVAADR